MQYANLGRTGLKVSRLCLGTMNFGPFVPEDECFRMMDRALEHGINFIDTADGYGLSDKGGQRGDTEQIIGRWLAQGGGRREKVVLATKVFGGMSDWPNDGGLSARHIRRGCDESLRRLQTDHVDLYQMHHVDRSTPWEEIWQAMEQLVREGKVIYTGSSNFAAWHIVKANEAARSRNLLGIVSEQSRYNLDCRTVELEVVPACLDYGVGIIPYNPLGGGLLTGALERPREGRRADEGFRKEVDQKRGQLEQYESLCRDAGWKPAHVALAWLLRQPAVAAPIVGPRTSAQLDELLPVLDLHLDDAALARLDQVFPGPGGTAPEAYAW